MKDIVFCTFITNNYKNSKVEFDLFYKSFKKFNPGVELFVFEDEEIKKIKSKNVNFSNINWKTSLAKEFYNDYETVVVLDSDHFVFSRLDEILFTDYDVAVPANYNTFLNIDVKITHCSSVGLNKNSVPCYTNQFINQDEFFQGGLVAGKKIFWEAYDFACSKHSKNIGILGENSVLNILLSIFPFKFKILDGSKKFTDEQFSCFYSCASLNMESAFYIFDDKIFCNNKQVKMYHVARGGENKPKFNNIFDPQIQNWFYSKIK